MKTNAAPARGINRACEQMIQINQHSEQKNQISFFPAVSEKEKGCEKRKNKMKKIMDYLLHVTKKKIIAFKPVKYNPFLTGSSLLSILRLMKNFKGKDFTLKQERGSKPEQTFKDRRICEVRLKNKTRSIF